MHVISLRVTAASFALALAALCFWMLLPGEPGPTRYGLASGMFTPHEHDGVPYLLYVPSTVSTSAPSTVFVAIHGMGAEPEPFASGLAADAERNGWVMVVPHLPYGDWTHTEALKAEEKRQMAWLDSLLTSLPETVGLDLSEKALFYGFSRGAQLSHRFALAYPQRVMAAAIMSPGTYTLPVEHSAEYDNHAPLDFPVGVNDIGNYCGKSFNAEAVRAIPFWVGVGEQDNSPGDVPRMWDKYLGRTRVERATAFAESLRELEADVELTVFQNLGHGESTESRSSAVDFLRNHELEQTSIDERGDSPPLTLERLTLALSDPSLALHAETALVSSDVA